MKGKLIFFVTEDWYFCSHRMPLARAARDAGFEVDVIARENCYGDKIRAEGFRLVPLNVHRGQLKPIREIRTLFALRKIFLQERPVLVHNVAIKPVVLGTLAARLAKVSVIINALAGLGYVFVSREKRARVLRSIASFTFRLLFRSSSVSIIVQNAADHDLIESFGVPKSRIALIAGSGVDVSVFKPLPEPEGPVVVAVVSRMLWDKGVGDMVEAARIVRRTRCDIRIRLIGPTDPANPSSIPEATLNEWVRDGTVEWLGSVHDVVAIWKAAQIGALPSYREGLPKSLLEAGACERALITTDVPGCRDVVIHEITGLIVPPRDPKALAEAIIRLAENPDLRRRMGKAARERIEEHFSVEKVVDQTLALYRSVLANP